MRQNKHKLINVNLICLTWHPVAVCLRHNKNIPPIPAYQHWLKQRHRSCQGRILVGARPIGAAELYLGGGGVEPYWQGWAFIGGPSLIGGPSPIGGPSLIGGAEPIYTRLRWNTDTKATSKKTVSERLLLQWSTATIPHNQFAHVLLGNLLAARSSSFLLAPQEKKKKEKKRKPRAARLIDCLSNRYSAHYWSLP